MINENVKDITDAAYANVQMLHKSEIKKGYPQAGKPRAPYALCAARFSLAISPLVIVRQPSSHPVSTNFTELYVACN